MSPYPIDLLLPTRTLWVGLQSALVARSSLTQLLGASDRIVIEGDDYPARPLGTDAQWARLVIVPIVVGPPVEYHPGAGSRVPFLLRAEQPALDVPGYVPAIRLERILADAHQLVEGWDPGLIGNRIRVTFPPWLLRPPQPAPLLDQARQVWWLSADYALEVTAKR